jgi:Uma2 family endonuclease
MATAVLSHLSIEEYLNSIYHPDRDYVDGALEERNLGEFDHGDLQLGIGTFLRNHSDEWLIRVVTETRVQVAPTRFRIPDICVMPLAWKRTPIIREAPLLCLEVLSPTDRMPRVLARYREFLAMGVREVWIFDPVTRSAHRMAGDTVEEHKTGTLTLQGTPITLDLENLFAVLDR